MLGLAQIADAARQGPPSTLWADEVFDALDAQGRDHLAGVLDELSADRGVVVITHTAQDELSRVARVHHRIGRHRPARGSATET
jgi:energy-coupling factor transporter ATP-binding protein EcfA2